MKSNIYKALIDKDIDGEEENPLVVINNNDKSILKTLKKILSSSNRVDIAVSYVVWSGLSLIYDLLLKTSKDSRILVSTDGCVTDPISLKKLQDLPCMTRVYTPLNSNDGFHLKTYLGEEEGGLCHLFIGSANISARAFGSTFEMGSYIKAMDKGGIVSSYKDHFNDLWNHEGSHNITDTFIGEYEKIFYLRKSNLASQNKDFNMYTNNNIKPNYMQKKALDSLSNLRTHSNIGLVIAATGSGKTYLSAFDSKVCSSKKILFLVHNRLILEDAMATFKRVYPKSKLLELSSKNISEIDSNHIIFTTDKSAKNLLYKNIPSDYFDYIIYDEAHKIGSGTIYEELISWFTPKFSLGITATPERTDNPRFLFEIFKYNVPYEIRLLEAMDHGLVCPFTYYGLEVDGEILGRGEVFNYEKLALYIKDLIKEKGHFGRKLQGIIFCRDVREGNSISMELNKIGINSMCASGNIKEDEIKKGILSLKSQSPNTINLICVVNRFNEGIDIPDINTIFMVRSTSSSIVYLQQLGRGLRRGSDPDKFVTVFDIIGNSKGNFCSLVEVLTGRETMDKRKLFSYANNDFIDVSPFINVKIQEETMKKVIGSISKDFKVKNRLLNKFKDTLTRYEFIPSLRDLYKSDLFQELDLFQLLEKNFYDPFIEFYVDKYSISKDDNFLSKFFTFITQFLFRSFNSNLLKEFASILKGNPSSNQVLINILSYKEDMSIPNAIKSNYYKKGHNFPKVFLYDKDINSISLNKEIILLLKENNAFSLFKEHISLIEHMGLYHNYNMKLFDLLDKGELLFNYNSSDHYMNVTGERMEVDSKKLFALVTVGDTKNSHDNEIIGRDKIVYFTKRVSSKEKAITKIDKIVEENFSIYLFGRFPHLRYEGTSYFNLGKVSIFGTPLLLQDEKGRWYHKVTLKLQGNLPNEFFNSIE